MLRRWAGLSGRIVLEEQEVRARYARARALRERAAVLKGDELYKLLDELDLRYPMWRRVAIEWLDNRIRGNSPPEERARARDALRRLLAENPQVHLRPEPEPDDGQAR